MGSALSTIRNQQVAGSIPKSAARSSDANVDALVAIDSAIDHPLELFGIASAMHGDLGGGAVDLTQLVGCEHNLE